MHALPAAPSLVTQTRSHRRKPRQLNNSRSIHQSQSKTLSTDTETERDATHVVTSQTTILILSIIHRLPERHGTFLWALNLQLHSYPHVGTDMLACRLIKRGKRETPLKRFDASLQYSNETLKITNWFSSTYKSKVYQTYLSYSTFVHEYFSRLFSWVASLTVETNVEEEQGSPPYPCLLSYG